MTNEKVAVPREVAEAIDHMRTLSVSNYRILKAVERGDNYATSRSALIRDWAFEGRREPDLLLQALVNGYEVAKTPEESVREYYVNVTELIDKFNDPFDDGARCGISGTLNLLGIKIEGVNE